MPLNGTDKIIAPYWADVDTRGTGNIYYRQTTDPNLLVRATSEIRTAFPMSQNVIINHLLIVTWDEVGYYDRNTDKVRTAETIPTVYVTCIMHYVKTLRTGHNITYCISPYFHIVLWIVNC